MKVYLIRHAQSEGNIMDFRAVTTIAAFNELLRRSPHHELTPEGQRQAVALANRLAEQPIERLYSSPFVRALATSAVLAERLSLTPVIVDELREVVPEALDERRRDASLRRLYLRSFARMAWRNSAGLTWRREYERAKVAWGKITAEPAGEVAAVSHGWTINLILLSLRRSRRWRILQRDTANAGVSVVVPAEASG